MLSNSMPFTRWISAFGCATALLSNIAGAQTPGFCCHNTCDLIPDISQCAPVLNGTVVPDCSVCIPPGPDCWVTVCGETNYDFCNTPIPADFFGPGSDPFDGRVYFQSNPPGTSSTIMVREDRMVLAHVGDCALIPIQLEQLSLISCAPITVQISGVDTQWNVEVEPSVVAPPPGTMLTCEEHSMGGIFISDFFVQAAFTFTNVINPSDVRGFDTGLAGFLPTHFQSSRPGNWVFNAPGQCSPNFAPGHDGAPGAGCTNGAPECCSPVGHEGPGHIHETQPPLCVPCECGACCTAGSGCVVATQDQGMGLSAEQVCTGMGGTYLGAGTDCTDSDADGLADALESNDCCGPKDACHTGTDPFNPDSDNDGILDGAELTGGTDPCVADGPSPPPPAGPDKVRYISFTVPSAGGVATAIRVKLLTLQHPDPPNLPQYPPPNFTALEGQIEWVGSPMSHPDPCNAGNSFYFAILQCTPYYADWNAVLNGSVLHVTGYSIVPSSQYEARQFDASCQGMEATCAAVSAGITMKTQRWGDIESPFQSPSPAALTQPNIIDIAAGIDAFRCTPSALIVPRCDIVPGLPNQICNISDIAAVVDGFAGRAYSFTGAAGPINCP